MSETLRTISDPIELRRLYHTHINRAGKFFQMYAGTSSELERYEDGILHLRIRSTKEGALLKQIVRNIAKSWRHDPELSGATGFRAAVYRSANPPGVVAGPEDLEKPNFAAVFAAALKAAADTTSDILVEIIEGTIDDATEENKS